MNGNSHAAYSFVALTLKLFDKDVVKSTGVQLINLTMDAEDVL